MTENEKRNGVLSKLKAVFKPKKEDCADIVTQAEQVIYNYINRRRNEIINKYCPKKNPLAITAMVAACGMFGYLIYMYL